MHLTREEERLLSGEEGEAKRRAMELIIALGDLSDAEELIPITSAQISGVSYKTISDAGLEFLEEFASDAQVTVKSTLNPLGMDMENWRELGISKEFAEKQMRIVESYRKMNVELTCTCTPYFVGNRPKRGEDISWAESSAVVFANSVLGSRTNKEGGPSALASAIIGKTPKYGLHLEDRRLPKVAIKVEAELSHDDYSLLGHSIGRKINQEVPAITGIAPEEDDHKSLGAAMAASGSISMYHYRREHSSCREFDTIEETISIDKEDLQESREILTTITEDIDIIAFGCPHLSERELRSIAGFLKGRETCGKCDVWFCVSRGVANRCPEQLEILRKFGKIACDTCMVVAPLEEISHNAATDSGKAAVYLPTLCKQKVLFAPRNELLEMISE